MSGVDRDDVLARVDLRSLLDALTGAAGSGGRWHCPDRDHPDEHPSVTVSVDGSGVQRWRCWSGDHHGTAIDAVMAAERLDVGGALRWLADHYGSWPVVEREPPPPTPSAGSPARAVVDYVQRAERLLWTPAGAAQRSWLAERGLGEEVLRRNRVGADPGRRFLPRPRGFPAGWPAVVYPALSPGGTVTYFQARYLDPPASRDKIDNPARSHATNPRVAWLHPPADTSPGSPPVLAVTEGVGDGLVAAQAGLATVAVLGSQYPDRRVVDQIAGAMERSSRLAGATAVICFDADPAGQAGAARLGDLLEVRRVPWRIVTPPDGLDLTDWARRDDRWASSMLLPGATLGSPNVGPPPDPVRPVPGAELGLGIAGPG